MEIINVKTVFTLPVPAGNEGKKVTCRIYIAVPIAGLSGVAASRNKNEMSCQKALV